MREFFRRYIMHDLGLKLLALLISIGLWWIVGRDPVVESIETAPIEFHHAPDNLLMTSESAFELRVTVSGPERLVRSVKPAEITAVLDLAGVKPGEHTFDLGPRQIHVPRGLTVEQVVPSQIHIDFNPSATRTVEVRPRVIGTFVSGYGITEVAADPATISIVGPQNRVNAIDIGDHRPGGRDGSGGQGNLYHTRLRAGPAGAGAASRADSRDGHNG